MNNEVNYRIKKVQNGFIVQGYDDKLGRDPRTWIAHTRDAAVDIVVREARVDLSPATNDEKEQAR